MNNREEMAREYISVKQRIDSLETRRKRLAEELLRSPESVTVDNMEIIQRTRSTLDTRKVLENPPGDLLCYSSLKVDSARFKTYCKANNIDSSGYYTTSAPSLAVIKKKTTDE